MKKLLAIMLLVSLLATFAACGGKKKTKTETTEATEVPTSTEIYLPPDYFD